MDTEVSRVMRRGNCAGGQKSARGQVTSGRKSIETAELGGNGKRTITVNCVTLGGFHRLYRQAVEEAGEHSCLSAPTLDIVSTLR